MDKEQKNRRRLEGAVVSDKMSKTAVVKITSIKEHAKYKKRFLMDNRYKAHDEKKEYHVGDKVVIEECRPISKGKKWRVVAIVGKKTI